MLVKHNNIDDINKYFGTDFYNIIYTDIKINEGKDIALKEELRAEINLQEINIFSLNSYLFGSIGHTEQELKAKNIDFKELKLLSNDYNSPEPSFKVVYVKILHNDKNILGLQIANEKNIETRLKKVQEIISVENSIELLAKAKIYENTDEINPDILNLAALMIVGAHAKTNKEIDANQVETLVKNKQFFLDVREDEEFTVGHIKGAINIPLRELYARQNELPKDKDIYVYCRTAHRSLDAVNFLASLGFDNVVNVNGGFIDLSFIEFKKDKGILRDSILSNYSFEWW